MLFDCEVNVWRSWKTFHFYGSRDLSVLRTIVFLHASHYVGKVSQVGDLGEFGTRVGEVGE